MSYLERNEQRLAWIFGSSRSGSTWLLRMLADWDGVVPIDDPHLGHHLGVWRPIPLAWAASEEEAPQLSTLLELKREEPGYFFSQRHRDAWWQPLRSLIQARFEAQRGDDPAARSFSPPTYVVKEPASHVAPLLAELFPRSKLIFLLRDGRDVVDSWLAAYRPGSWAIDGGAFPVSAEGRLPLVRWLAGVWAYRTEAVLEAFEAREPQDRVLIRYEEVRERPAEGLATACDALGLDDRRAEEIAARHRFERLPERARGPLREARSAAPGGWRENLSPRERAALHEALGATLERVGYLSEDEGLEPLAV
ncbi:MAG TPA: sulfotransferase [Solirubrobacterales bacterium]|nr:sulfotransferase [Solirubrobacterales bacterium]